MMSDSSTALAANRDPSDGDKVLGTRLRQRRKVRAMSLQNVADIADISIGLLSQIERGLAMPSVRSLGAICRALDMPVAWLFDGPSAEDSNRFVVRRSDRRMLDLGNKGMIKELMTPDSFTGIQMMRLVIRPGGSTGTVPYNHPQGSKCGTVLSGVLGLEIDDQTHIIGAGESFAFEATRLIRFWCEGDQDTEVLWVVSPALY